MSKIDCRVIGAFVAVIVISYALLGCGGGQTEKGHEQTAEDSNYIMVDSFNACGVAIGKRAVVSAAKADFEQMSAAEFQTFVDDVVVAAGDGGADYLTVDFHDGTGLTFPSCSGDFVFYGKLDKEGMMADECETYSYSKGAWVKG